MYIAGRRNCSFMDLPEDQGGVGGISHQGPRQDPLRLHFHIAESIPDGSSQHINGLDRRRSLAVGSNHPPPNPGHAHLKVIRSLPELIGAEIVPVDLRRSGSASAPMLSSQASLPRSQRHFPCRTFWRLMWCTIGHGHHKSAVAEGYGTGVVV